MESLSRLYRVLLLRASCNKLSNLECEAQRENVCRHIELGDKAVFYLGWKTFSGGQFSGHDVPLAFPGDDFLLQKEDNSVLEY